MREDLQTLQTQVAEALVRLNAEETQQEITQLEELMASPSFWDNQEQARADSKKHAKLSKKINPWLDLRRRVSDAIELAAISDKSMEQELTKDLAELESEYAKRAFALKLSGPYDDRDAILSIHAGTGGTDAQDWAEMLERMYVRHANSSDWKVDVIDRGTGEEAGIKHVTLQIEGDWAYGKLRGEHGVHRLVRLSPFNADNLRQTSFALVEVAPLIDEPESVEIDESDIKVDVYRAGGKGGQSVNTTDSAVRITHEPTGIVVAIQNERSQLQNKQTAMNILRSKLAQLQQEQHTDKISEITGPDVQAAWGNQIRNYVLHPYTLVKDTRTKHETSDTQSVLDGNIDDFIDSYLHQNHKA